MSTTIKDWFVSSNSKKSLHRTFSLVFPPLNKLLSLPMFLVFTIALYSFQLL